MNTDTSKWETFKNTFYTFKYPADKYVVDTPGGDRDSSLFLRKNTGRSGGEDFIFFVFAYKDGAKSKTIEEYLKTESRPFHRSTRPSDIKTEPVMLNKIKAARIVSDEGSPAPQFDDFMHVPQLDDLYFTHAGRIFSIQIKSGPEAEAILKTFELV